MSSSQHTAGQRITLFVRNGTVGADTQKRRILNRLGRLADDGRVADVDVRTWPARLCTDDAWTEREAQVLDTVRQFEQWAEDADVSLEPFFRTRTDTHLATDRERAVRVLPVMAVAVYDETSTLDTVAPHAGPDDPYTVSDCVADLEASTDGANDSPEAIRDGSSPERAFAPPRR